MSSFKEGQINQLANALEANGYTAEDVTSLGQGDLVGIRSVLRGQAKIVPIETANPVFPVSVDYGMGIEELVKLGRYDWSNDDITSKHFPTKRTGKVDIALELIHFSRNISSEAAIKELDRMGLRPAEARELLAFGEKYPDVQREFPIVALGSVWRVLGGDRRVVCLGRGDARRVADLTWFEFGWSVVWRFAAVRK